MTMDRLLGKDRPGSPVWAHVVALVGAVWVIPAWVYAAASVLA